MGPGKAFELFVKRILIHIGFSEVVSDGLYIYDGAPGQMIQGLGEAHNADVLLEPPVQTPFYSKTRLLIECKDYRKKISLNVVRSALGLREDINNFNIVDMAELATRRRQNRRANPPVFDRYSYQVAIAALWLNKSTDELEMKREAINCKANLLSNMVVYYTEHGQPVIKMISIDRFQLEDAIKRLR